MRKLLLIPLILLALVIPVSASDFTPPKVPESAAAVMPKDPVNLQEGIRYILRQTIAAVRPDLAEAYRICSSLVLVTILVSVCGAFPGATGRTGRLVGVISVSTIVLSPAGALINLAVNVITQISSYGKLLLPVMTGALAAQGGVTSSAALYAGTAAFNAVLSYVITGILVPFVYCFLALAAVNAVTGLDTVKRIRDLMKGVTVWTLKTSLYVFTGYMGITGVVSGSTDAAALKATKLTISSIVPVVGGILSDASEAVLVSAGTLKNAAGLYGMLALLAIWAGPFAKIGVHYLLLRLSGMICSIFGQKEITELIQDLAGGMGILLAMTGAVCLMFLISVFCFMRGVV